ncbi:MaoC family dehydratase [Blastococcus sp. BMG 814]|uniref:MaoC family dehydratase n=1 Tax=Blastococcus carthaginiensis TaxID=3050034 RepID=A0ABT9IE99_9ACTN|nr:MaoC family dehydratase [Blastococcus carthaginiensis]MDP5183906.1 MaoC family dehydratase [Blastococcus carthaginiensis]
MRVFTGPDDLQSNVGTEIGVSDWLTVDQERIDQFAEATGDHQWIHVDVERAKAESPFGGPIAHGYLTLSLLVPLQKTVFRVDGTKMGVNYGLDKARFPAPVPAGSRIRSRIELVDATPVEGGIQVKFRHTIEQEGAAKPACVVESIARYYF